MKYNKSGAKGKNSKGDIIHSKGDIRFCNLLIMNDL